MITPHLSQATSAAWGRCNKAGTWGVLTAGHAIVGNQPGTNVPLADAAFVAVGTAPLSPSLLPVRRFPAVGLQVTVEGKSQPQIRTVFKVMNSLGVTYTRAFQVLAFLDQPCAAGDSGVLVKTKRGEAVGIYLGDLRNAQIPSGRFDDRGQNDVHRIVRGFAGHWSDCARCPYRKPKTAGATQANRARGSAAVALSRFPVLPSNMAWFNLKLLV